MDNKAKCRHLKKLPVKGFCCRCSSEFIDWRYSQSCWYFRPSFVNCFPSNLLSGSTLPPPLLHLPQSPFIGQFFFDDILQCLLSVLSLYESIINTPISLLTKTGLHSPNRRSLLSELNPGHGFINYIDTKAKCRHLKGLCGRCLSV
jgi:hypothetical protein